ncbi:MAG: hypothetical protein U5J64_06995 [Halobacteriales archaeon]|nr:hypothetical protein [Halobacteriales archaeon]
MMSSSDPTRRVPKKLGESDEFWRGYTLDDLLVGGTPFIVAVLLTSYVIPPEYRYVGYVLSAIGLVVGAVIVYATPDHMTASEWVSTYVHHIRRPKEMEHVRYDFDSVREQTDFPESRAFEVSQRTQELTDVKRVHKDRDAVERMDGTFVGAVRVEPANMALATDRRWRENVSAFADFFNNSVEWSLQMYSTTTEFPVEDYLRRRERRLDDDDVAGNPVFRRLIDEWLDWYPRELEARGTNIREHYIIVPVRRDEVTANGDEGGLLDTLSGVPVAGAVFGALASGDGMTEEEVKARALDELDERLRMVENEGIQRLDGCRAHRVEAGGLARVLAEFWEGEPADFADMDGALRENPVVVGEFDMNGTDAEAETEENDAETEEDTEGSNSFLRSLFSRGGNRDEDETDGNVTDDVEEMHKALVASSEAVFERNAAKLGARWTKTMWAEGYPDQPVNGFLERLFTEPGVDTDVAIHVEPRDTRRAQEELKDRVGTLEAEYERKRERRDVDARGVQKDLEDAEEMYDVVRNTPTEVFDVSTYVTVREDTRDALESAASDVRAGLRRAPANIRPVTASRRQDLAVRSTSPVANDHLNKKTAMMGGAVGATFPFSSSSLIEAEGVEYGVHAFNGSPVIVDRFGRETGYNALVIGNIGSGKSFSTKLNLTRTLAQDEDAIVVMLDPLKGFVGVNRALGGERVVVGGNVGLNPLEIRETPDEVLEETGGELDPFGAKLKDVMSFFESYFESRGDPLGERRGTLENAVKDAYNQKGIYRDPDTHGNESPLVTDVIDVLRTMAEKPDEYTVSESDEERRKIETNASELLIGMEPFTEGGEFENLSSETEIDITGSKVVYLDLQQQETRGGTGLMMQLLFNAVYERAKEETDKRVIFAIDEARYIMKDSTNLSFLEQAVRHSRHYDLSIQFITQTIDEFFAQDESEAIADNCSLKLLHRIEGMDNELADELDLTPRQKEYVATAMAGDDEAGYSEALLGVADEGWFPIHVRANDFEKRVVDYDPDEGDELLDSE